MTLKKLTTGKLDWKNLKRGEKESITHTVKNHVPDMYSRFMEHIEGDVLGFILSPLATPVGVNQRENSPHQFGIQN